MMSVAHKSRGSILMMVVGLLTIIGMLGTTFLVITRLDARQSATIEAKSQVTPLAAGMTAVVAKALAKVLYIGSDGPYSSKKKYQDLGRKAWGKYVIYPSDKCSAFLAGDGHPSFIVDEDKANPQDWDKDGKNDAHLFDTMVMNPEGKKYYAAIMVEDTGGRVCVNVAASGKTGEITSPVSPANIDLKGFLGEMAYMGSGDGKDHPGLHPVRCGKEVGQDMPSVEAFWEGLGCRLMNPASSFRPFSIGEEVTLRTSSTAEAMGGGRMYKILKNAGVYAKRQHLTTYSVSRALVRRPWIMTKSEKVLLDTSTGRDAIFQQAFKALTDVGLVSNPVLLRIMAGNFVANLWAYQSPGMTDSPWAFNVPGTIYVVYGLAQGLVITEGYARHIKATNAPDNNNWAWGYAIEVMNPTKTAIAMGSSYQVQGPGGTPAAVSGSPSVAANGGKVVLYSFGSGGGYDGDAAGFFGGIGGNWYEVPQVDFSGPEDNVRVYLLRDGAPVDTIWNSDLDYDCDNKSNPTQASPAKDARRDDRTSNRARYNIGEYKLGSSHALGAANGVTDGELNAASGGAKYSAPIIRGGKDGNGGKIESIGELGRIYCIGSFSRPGALGATMSFTLGYNYGISGLASGALLNTDWTGAPGRLDYCPFKVKGSGWGGGKYPDIPVAWEEWFRVMEGEEDGGIHRFYGLINVNTADKQVLERLPLPASITVAGVSYPVDASAAAQAIINYRNDTGRPSITSLRAHADSNFKGFLSASEVAVPLAKYAEGLMGNPSKGSALRKSTDFIDGRDAIYRAIANCITVHSDVFVARVRIMLDNPPEYTWYFLAVIDRSNCTETSDRPVVRLFTEAR